MRSKKWKVLKNGEWEIIDIFICEFCNIETNIKFKNIDICLKCYKEKSINKLIRKCEKVWKKKI